MACVFNLDLDQKNLAPLSCGGALNVPSAGSGVRAAFSHWVQGFISFYRIRSILPGELSK